MHATIARSEQIADRELSMDLHATHPGNSAPEAGSTRFSYASGSRPLDGYTIKRGIGRGGFGEVYYATSDGGKEVALKLVRSNLEIELRGVGHCLNLKHVNLLALHDVKRDDRGDCWVVMEYVAGDSLEDVIESHPEGMPVHEALKWFQGMVAGVAYLHDHGIVHRDLKPGNIFCDEGVVKIGDYGLSKFVSCSRRSGQTESVGTVHYMAPEVANGRYGKEIDIYALGVILYEMLTGVVPFEGESVGEVLMKHLTAEPDLSRLNEPYRTVAAKALTKDPAARYRNVVEMVDALSLTKGGLGNPFSSATKTNEQRQAAQAEGIASALQPTPDELEEPIWRGIRDGWHQIDDAWHRSNLRGPTRVILLITLCVLLVINAHVIIGILIPLFLIYAVYYIVRSIVLSLRTPPVAAPAMNPERFTHAIPLARVVPESREDNAPVKPVSAAPEDNNVRRWGRRRLRPKLPPKSARQIMTEWIGGMLMSVVVTVLVFAVVALLRNGDVLPNQFAWLTIVSVAGSWLVLTATKFWEGKKGDEIPRRFVLGLGGMALGLIAYSVQQGLFVSLPYVPDGFVQNDITHDPAGIPRLPVYVGFYACLFALLRWWHVADPLRGARLEIFSTIAALIAGWLLEMLWGFPQPWGLMTAAGVSVAVQLSSPWVAPNERRIINHSGESVA